MEDIHETDESLFAKWRLGDLNAAERLVTRYENKLYGFLYRMLGNRQEAEDAFQETFLRVHAKAQKFKPDFDFRPWLYAIAANHCRDRLRRAKRQPLLAVTPEILQARQDSRPEPDKRVEAKEKTQRLEAAIAALPVKQRAVFIMARYENLAYDEIATALAIPVGTVKSRMNTAVRTLLAAVEETP